MGLLAKLTQKVAPFAAKFGGFIPGVGPVVQKAGALLSKLPAKKVAAVIGAGGAFGAAETLGQRVAGAKIKPGMGSLEAARSMRGEPGTFRLRRKHRKGLSGRDILGAQKVARLVHAFGYKPKIKPRRKGR